MTIQATFNRSQLKWDTYMFLGDQYLLYSLTDNSVSLGPRAIATGWPGLSDTQFGGAIDAAVPFSFRFDPMSVTLPPEKDYMYIFRGDQYVRYNFSDDKIIYGPLDIAQWWPGMKDAGFDRDIDAAFLDHRDVPFGTVDTYVFFKGDKYLLYDGLADRVSDGPRRIADGWPGLADAEMDRDLDAVVYYIQPAQVLAGPNHRYCYFVKGDKVLHFDMEDWKPLTGAVPISDFWYGLKGTPFASAAPAPPFQPVKAHADFKITFVNAGEADPEPYGSISFDLKDGGHFRIWTQQNQGGSIPTRWNAAPSMNLPFTAADIAQVGFWVDEYDPIGSDDILAHGTKDFTGNGSYTVTGDGSVTVEVTITSST
ncbi:hemopexin repeat-containing protein [Actinomadura fibrosa]|uniref:Hemopexin repeat-containing protein n=1 Tax=Actinomadura fibrosa TaxID=111802 RepID=A0ABW2Y2I3_9ACTN|nr:hemopexin repeat-containing protein [Actinomadura fibrosa]